MDIRLFTGDMLTMKAGVLVHGVNCQGVMGSGIALTIKEMYPKAYEEYVVKCNEHKDNPEEMLGTVQIVQITPYFCIANLFSQPTFGYDGGPYARAWAIEKGLRAVSAAVHNVTDSELKLIHIPQIGGCRGGLDFHKEVMPLIEKTAADYSDITYGVWTYDGTINK